MNTKLIIVACVLSLLFMACGKDDVNDTTPYNPPDTAPFTFLKVGNKWEYGHYNCENELTYSYKTTGIYLEKKGTYIVEGYPVTGGQSLWLVRDSNWYQSFDYNYEGDVFTLNSIILYGDCYVGQKWLDDRKLELEVLSVSDTVTVPAGTFYDCIKVMRHAGYGLVDSYLWYHKDIGFLMQAADGYPTTKLISKNF